MLQESLCRKCKDKTLQLQSSDAFVDLIADASCPHSGDRGLSPSCFSSELPETHNRAGSYQQDCTELRISLQFARSAFASSFRLPLGMVKSFP